MKVWHCPHDRHDICPVCAATARAGYAIHLALTDEALKLISGEQQCQ